MRTLGFFFALAVVAAPAPAAHAYVNLTTDGGHLFDIYEYSGYLSNGTSDAYDGCYTLYVDGTSYSGGGSYTTSMSGRQVELPEVAMGSLMVRRLIYVPATGGDWGRYVDVLRNPGATDVAATVRIYCNLGSDSGTVIAGSSSGDTTVSAVDQWVATDDAGDGTGDPSLAHVLQGEGALASASTVTAPSGTIEWTIPVTVPAGGQAAVMTFAVQTSNRAGAMAEAMRLVTLPADALAGIDAILPDVVNFPVGGAPIVRFTAPTTAAEGELITFEIEVIDMEGDPATWAWDTDGDGVYAELAGATSYTVPAGTTDGDATLTVGVEASDGTETRERLHAVTITNVDPTITSTAPTPALFIGSSYRYEVAVDDPAGDADPITYVLTASPTGMNVNDSGVITWVPTPDQRDTLFSIELTVQDGDGGSDTEAWDLMVSNNRPPTEPTPVSPIDRVLIEERLPTLLVDNATDPDGDDLQYYFRVDRVSSLDSPALQESPPVVEMTDQTSWTVPSALDDGTWYWETWVSDGLLESGRRYGVFSVGTGGGTADAGTATGDAGGGGGADAGTIEPPPRRRDRGGCSASAAPGSPAGAALLLAGLGLVAGRRRRR